MTLTDSHPKAVQRRYSADVRRRQIIDETSRLMSTSGFNAVSLADVAEACGVTKTSVLRYFPTMHDLMRGVVEDRDLDTAVPLPDEVPHTPEDVRAYLRLQVDRNLERREIIRLFALLSAEALDPAHPAHEFMSTRRRLAADALEDLLVFKADPRLAAAQLLAFWNGLDLAWAWDADVDVVALWEDFCDSFFAEPGA